MNSIGKDKLDYLIGIASIDCGEDDVALFDGLDVSDVVFSKRFYRIKKRRIKADKRGLIAVRRAVSVAAMVAVAVLVTGLITVSSIPTLRDKVLGSIIDWCENYLTITYDVGEKESDSLAASETETEIETEKETTSVSENPIDEAPKKIETVKKPTHIEDGVIESVVLQNKTQIIVDYYLGDTLLYSYKQLLLNDKNLYANSANAIVEPVNVGNINGKLVELVDRGERVLIWNDEEYVYQIVTQQCEGDYLIHIAQSVE